MLSLLLQDTSTHTFTSALKLANLLVLQASTEAARFAAAEAELRESYDGRMKDVIGQVSVDHRIPVSCPYMIVVVSVSVLFLKSVRLMRELQPPIGDLALRHENCPHYSTIASLLIVVRSLP